MESKKTLKGLVVGLADLYAKLSIVYLGVDIFGFLFVPFVTIEVFTFAFWLNLQQLAFFMGTRDVLHKVLS